MSPGEFFTVLFWLCIIGAALGLAGRLVHRFTRRRAGWVDTELYQGPERRAQPR